jgi:hypothetical protein
MTYGYYDTRWRRWPLETVAQATTPGKGTPLTAPVQKDVQPFVPTRPEEEDRKAPPPSVPAGEQTPGGLRNPPGQGGTGAPGGPGGQQGQQGQQQPGGTGAPGGATRAPGYSAPAFPTPPQGTPNTPPTGQGTQPSTQPLFKNVSPDSPLNRNTTGPMGDSDPPPSLPFGPALVAPEQPSRDVSQQPVTMPVRRPAVRSVQTPSNDPPPAPPIALASYEE